MMKEEFLMKYIMLAIDSIVTFAPKLISAVLVLLIGFWFARRITRVARKGMENAQMNKEIVPFLSSFIQITLKVIIVLLAAGMIGIEMTAIVGVLAAAGFAVGLALQGSLGNFAAGILVMILRPYKVGDLVEINGRFGKIEEIHIFNTVLCTPGLKTMTIPNGKVIEDTIVNYTQKGSIRLELEIHIPYEESFPKVKNVILKALDTVAVLLKDPAPEIGILHYDTHTIKLAIRPYVEPDNYWEGIFMSYETIKAALSEHGVKMAYSEGIELGRIGD